MSSKRRGIWFSTPQTKTYPRGPRFWISAWLPVAVGIAVIAVESTAAFGSDRTSDPLRWLVQLALRPVERRDLGDLVHHLHSQDRATSLATELLGLVWLRAWRMTCPDARFLSHAGLALARNSAGGQLGRMAPDLPAQPHRFSVGRAAGLLRRRCHDRNRLPVPAPVPARVSRPAEDQERPTALRIAMFAEALRNQADGFNRSDGQMAFIHRSARKTTWAHPGREMPA